VRSRWVWIGLAAILVAGVAGAAGIYQSGQDREAGATEATIAPASPLLQATFTPAPTSPAGTPALIPMPVPQVAPRTDFVQLVAAGADTFNPVAATSPASLAVLDLIYPRLVGQDVKTGAITPTELAERWEISADGLTYTFFLRDTVYWSDGRPVTAADVRFTYAALADPAVQSPYRDRTQAIARIETPDPYTVVFTLAQPDCTIMQGLRSPLLPSHRYASDLSDLASNPLNAAPEVSAGPFRFTAHTPGQQIVLEANPSYWKGAPSIQRWTLRTVVDPAQRLRLLAEGEADLVWFSASETAGLDLAPAGGNLIWERTPAPAFHFLALNLADPANPQPGHATASGEAEDGALVPQAAHPILGERAVRQAIALGIHGERVIAEAMGGYGYALGSDVLPSIAWAHAEDVAPVVYDPDQARALLDEAGWRTANGDGEGVREKDGRRMALRLDVNAGNPVRVAAAERIVQDLAALGIAVELRPAAFEDVAADLLGQRYDLALMGWENLAADPGLNAFWSSNDDAPGVGANFTSFQDADVDAWLEQARTLPGCELGGRGELYRQVQRRVAEGLPYGFLAGETALWAYAPGWTGISPGTWGLNSNIYEWQRAE